MIDHIDIINFGVAASGLTVAVLSLLLNWVLPYLDRWSKRFFAIFFLVLTAYIFSDLISQVSLVLLGPGYGALSLAAIFFESLLSSVLMPLLTVYLLRCTGEDARHSRILPIVCILWLAYAVLLISTQFSGVFYSVSAENVYRRGPLYPVLLIPPVLLMLVNLAAVLLRRKRLSLREQNAFLGYLLIPLAGMVVQMLSYGLLMIVITTSVGAVIMFFSIVVDQIEDYIEIQKKDARQEANIAVLSMRPHFIYNTMSSIYYLCKIDPEKALPLIYDFTNYLRKNFSAIAKEGTIPFSDELSHVETYLAVEQARFEDLLSVEFETEYTAFRIPPLTLQPIVENAVKYGVDPELEPLTITIRTCEENGDAVITVEDDGPGFDPAVDPEDDREPHIALDNIRKRLSMLCGGTLKIGRRESGGTKAVIRIPV